VTYVSIHGAVAAADHPKITWAAKARSSLIKAGPIWPWFGIRPKRLVERLHLDTRQIETPHEHPEIADAFSDRGRFPGESRRNRRQSTRHGPDTRIR